MLCFCVPAAVFQIQERQQLQRMQKGERNVSIYNFLMESYEEDGYERLRAFAKGLQEGRSYCAVEVDNGWNMDSIRMFLKENSIMEMPVMSLISDLSWLKNAQSHDALADYWGISDYVPYVVYNNDDGEIAFYLCCIDVHIFGESIVRLLLDAKDGTVYHAEILGDYTKAYLPYKEYEKIILTYMSDISSIYCADAENRSEMRITLYYDENPLSFRIYNSGEMNEKGNIEVGNIRVGFEHLYNMVSYAQSTQISIR